MNRLSRILLVLAANPFCLAALGLIWTTQARSRTPRAGHAALVNGINFGSGQSLENSTSHSVARADPADLTMDPAWTEMQLRRPIA